MAGSTPGTERLVLGLDVGGTWTRAMLATTAGRRIGSGRAAGANPSSHGIAVATSPGRLEVVRRSPTIVLDAAHNPHGAEATAAALEDSFSFSPLIGVIGVMGDKDVEGVLAAFEPHLEHLVVTQSSADRAMRASRLAELAVPIYGEDRVTVVPRLADAIDAAAALAESDSSDSLSSGAVLVTGSVVTVGEARVLLGGAK